MFSQIKDRKHIEQNFQSVAKVLPLVGTAGAGGVKNFSVGICDGAPSTARSSLNLFLIIFSWPPSSKICPSTCVVRYLKMFYW